MDENKENESNGSTSSKLNLYILIHFAPDLSPVKQRMMYASSRPSLKAFLGQSNFSEDYHCSSQEELSLKKIVDARTLHHKIDFRSDAEIEKEQAALESVATSAKSQVMKSLPIDVKDSAVSSINSYKSESCKCVFLTLTADTKGIEGEEKKVEKLSEIKDLLNDTDPKYILFWYSKSKQDNDEEKEQLGNKRIFGFYSKVECSFNDFKEEYMDYHIFPVRDKKEQFAMPKAPKGRRKSKSKKRKKINLDDL